MLVLCVQGSPRKEGNTAIMIDEFMNEAKKLGVRTHKIEVTQKRVYPCIECDVCEKKGLCAIEDDMQEIYGLFRKADIVVIGTPVFFYGATAHLKVIIDRSQTLWSRKYVHKLNDPGRQWRKGFMLTVGATKGKNLFDGLSLTAKYFFDAIGAEYAGFLGYRRIEVSGAIKDHRTAMREIRDKADELIEPFCKRKNVLFICNENACRSQMAAAFARVMAGDRWDVQSAGSVPADDINPVMVETMAEKGIDMAYIKPLGLDQVMDGWTPNLIVSMGCGEGCPYVPGVSTEEWNFPDPGDKSIDFMRNVRNEIEDRVRKLVASFA